MSEEKNIFAKIRDKEADANIVFQNDYVTAFHDIYPSAPIHILIIPNKEIKSLNEIQECDAPYLSEIMIAASQLAKQFEIAESGYRLITNCNKNGGQEIDYLHFHLVGGVRLGKMISLPKESKKIWKN
jgi:histidine triad (HIT) family protein